MLNPGEVHVWRVQPGSRQGIAAHRGGGARAPRGLPRPRCAAATCAPTPHCAPSLPRVHQRPARIRAPRKGKTVPGLGARDPLQSRAFARNGAGGGGAGCRGRRGYRADPPVAGVRRHCAALLSRRLHRTLRRARFLPPLDALRSPAQGARSGPVRRRSRAPGRLERAPRSMPDPTSPPPSPSKARRLIRSASSRSTEKNS